MQSETRAFPASDRTRPDVAKRLLRPIGRWLQTGDPAATLDRLFSSEHVKDLRLIIAVAVIAVLLVFVIGLPLAVENEVQGNWQAYFGSPAPGIARDPTLLQNRSKWIFVHIGFAAVGNFLRFFLPVLAVFGAVVAWAYQVASARLGVVDLFACEISTLCRVAAVVDTVRRFVGRFDQGSAPEVPLSAHGSHPTYQFTSQESYFPVFEHGVRDLQSLEARVVINITAFYTFMKAARDRLRTFAQLDPPTAELESASKKDGPREDAVCNLIYMLFLAMESARYAVKDLVEFEPEKAERTIVILISELEAYRFLYRKFPRKNDVHHQRIILRDADYQDLVPELCSSVMKGRASEKTEARNSQWEPALRLLPELQRRYKDRRRKLASELQ
jgi:hypothetical protein